MSYQFSYNPSIELLTQSASDRLNSLLKNAEVLFLLSGGSALKLVDTVNTSLLGNHLTITVLDERYSTDPSVNIFAQIAHTTFYSTAKEKNCSFIDTRVQQNETIDQLAARFEHSLRNWKTAHPNGAIIATQGMGPDGHTAGIMPHPENPKLFQELFEDENRWVTGYDAGNKNEVPLRVTTTIPFLKLIDYSILYVTGENKKEVLQKAVLQETKLYEVPVKVIQEMNDVEIYTDQELSSAN